MAQISWQQASPGASGGLYTYHYDGNGNLIKSTDNPFQETVYTWEGNKIIKSERIKNGELQEYKLYGYDDAGNVGEITEYNKQANGDFVMSFIFVYLYHSDGNIYKRLVYYPGEESYINFHSDLRKLSGYREPSTHSGNSAEHKITGDLATDLPC